MAVPCPAARAANRERSNPELEVRTSNFGIASPGLCVSGLDSRIRMLPLEVLTEDGRNPCQGSRVPGMTLFHTGVPQRRLSAVVTGRRATAPARLLSAAMQG